MKFSVDRKYLATGGEDGVINIWKVREVSRRDWLEKRDVRIFEDAPIHQFAEHTVWESIRFIMDSPILSTFLGPKVDSCYLLL